MRHTWPPGGANAPEPPPHTIVYATLIIKGRKTIDQVPALLRKQVEEILADLEVEV